MRLIQVNLNFVGLTITNLTGSPGAQLPPPSEWIFASFAPSPDSLNFLAVDFSGVEGAFNGPVFSATFTVDAAASSGAKLLVSVEADVRDKVGMPINLVLTEGEVTVSP